MTGPSLCRGDVVIVDFGELAKVRPAVIVQNDRDNRRLSNTIVAQVTSNISRAHEPTQHLVDLGHVDWSVSGLRRPSVINCSNLVCIRQAHVVRSIGKLSADTLLTIDECLKSALGIA